MPRSQPATLTAEGWKCALGCTNPGSCQADRRILADIEGPIRQECLGTSSLNSKGASSVLAQALQTDVALWKSGKQAPKLYYGRVLKGPCPHGTRSLKHLVIAVARPSATQVP
jgi:hypothetical protein